MGALIHYTRDPFKPQVYEVRPTIAGITAQDAVRATFPELADRAVQMQRNGRALYADDVLQDGDIVWLSVRPEWFGVAAASGGFWSSVFSYFVQAFVYAAVSYLISYLLRPRGKKDKAASPAYSVAIDQNAARLGGVIPVQYGRCLAMPDIAAQPYAEFLSHNEQVSMILCLGMGEYDIHDILLGESRVVDFPPGNVQTWIFDAADHGRVLGNIERITGVCEDMLTIPETMGVDVAAPNDPPEVSIAGSVSGGVLIPADGSTAQLWTGLVPGRRYVVSNSLGGSVIATYVGIGPNNSAVFDAPLPSPGAPILHAVIAQLTPIDDANEGRVMLLYSQQGLPEIGIGEILYIDQQQPNTRFGPFQLYRSDSHATRLYFRIQGAGFVAASGENGIWPQQWVTTVRNQFVVYFVTEYVEGIDPAEPFRWRGWYASCRPGVTVDEIYIDMTAPNGLAWITDGGDYRNISVTFYVDMQLIDDDGNPIGGLRRETITMSGATSTARRQTFPFTVAPGRYRVRVARVNTRDQRASKEVSACTLASIRTRVHHAANTPAYENCTLIVMKFTASAGLNAASNRRVKVDCTRRVAYLEGDRSIATSNPAFAFRDAYCNTDYGGARPQSEFDLAKFLKLYPQWNQVNGFNGIFDGETTLIEALQAILAPVKALPLPTGKLMSVVQDAPRERFYAFGNDTIVKDSLTIAYLFDGENQPDCLCVVYNDPATWVEGRVYYPTEGVRPETIELFGCTSASHALAWAKLSWQQRQANRKRAQFELEGEGYLLDPLDRFAVTIPTIGHAVSGSCIQYNATTGDMLCDCEVPTDTAICHLINPDGTLAAACPAVRVDVRTVRLTSPPFAPHGPDRVDDTGVGFTLGKNDAQFMEFTVTDLQTSAQLRVNVTGQQYDAASYSGTFVQNWITGD